MLTSQELILKYNKPTPRYTSYPPVPYWNNAINEAKLWSVLENSCITEGVDLYIHIPFCQKLCWYCGCNRVVSRNQEKINDYLDILIQEWKLYTDKFPSIKINSIHFGGGTPNNISVASFKSLMNVFTPYFADEMLGAIELDPRILTKEFLLTLKKYNFKRLSMGIQDFDPQVQKAINRIQPYELIEEVCSWVRKMGFQSLNFDLIYGLPRQNGNSIEQTLSYIEKLSPDLMALYSYAHLPNQLKNQRLIKDSDLPSGDSKNKLYQQAKPGLENLGYIEVGLDHFAKNNSYLFKAYEEKQLERSFMGYTDKKSNTLIGLGVSAISQTPNTFVQNSKDITIYADTIMKGKLCIIKGHSLSSIEQSEAEIIFKIMCYGFIEYNDVETHPLSDKINRAIESLINDGLLVGDTNKYIITDRGRPYLRNVASVFDSHFSNSQNKIKSFSSTA